MASTVPDQTEAGLQNLTHSSLGPPLDNLTKGGRCGGAFSPEHKPLVAVEALTCVWSNLTYAFIVQCRADFTD